MFEPKPKLAPGSECTGGGIVRDANGTEVYVEQFGHGHHLFMIGEDTESGVAHCDALAVLRPVDPVWLAAIEVVRAQDVLLEAASRQHRRVAPRI